MFGSRRMPGRHLVERRRLLIPVCFVLSAVACAGGSDTASSASSADTEAGAHAARDPLAITTDLGVVRGRRSDIAGVRAFLAMPYAAPPTATTGGGRRNLVCPTAACSMPPSPVHPARRTSGA